MFFKTVFEIFGDSKRVTLLAYGWDFSEHFGNFFMPDEKQHIKSNILDGHHYQKS